MTPKKVVFSGGEDVVIESSNSEETADDAEQEQQQQQPMFLRKELLRLESLVRCHVQHQWHLSIENYRCFLLSWLVEP